jgi:hypothetical protein
MKFRTTLIALIAVATFALSLNESAKASEVILDSTSFIVGRQSFTDAFELSGPGTLTITLSDVAWPTTLASLDLVVGTAQGLLGPEMGVGTQSYQVSGGDIFAQWFGTAQGALDAGAFGLKIEFAPSASPVPLPNSVLLLLSGLLAMGWLQLRRDSSVEIKLM